MENVECVVKGNKLVLTVDLTKDFGPSSTGKTTTVAKCGTAPVPGHPGMSFGLNVYKK